MKYRTLLYPFASLRASGLTLSGCALSPAQPAASVLAPAISNAEAGRPAAGFTSTGTEQDADDVMIAQIMIRQHEQASTMNEMMLDMGTSIDSAVGDLAEVFKAAQGPEIGEMKSWLDAWGEPDSGGPMGHSMEGPMGADDLAALGAAQDVEASRLFLTQRANHHRGAGQMAQEQTAIGSNPQAITLASGVVRDQQAENKTMEALLQKHK